MRLISLFLSFAGPAGILTWMWIQIPSGGGSLPTGTTDIYSIFERLALPVALSVFLLYRETTKIERIRLEQTKTNLYLALILDKLGLTSERDSILREESGK